MIQLPRLQRTGGGSGRADSASRTPTLDLTNEGAIQTERP